MIGWHCSGVIQKRYDELYAWKRVFIVVYADISYGGATILEVVQHVLEQNQPDCKRMLQYLEQGLKTKRNKSFSEIWDESIEEGLRNSQLNQQDLYELKRVGLHIGNVDKEQQLAMIRLYLDKLELAITILEKEKDKKMKSYKILGALASIFVIVLLL